MEVTTEKIGEATIVVIQRQHLDMGNAAAFSANVAPVIEAGSTVLFDMSRVQFVDSSGLGALMACRRQLLAVGGDLRLFGLSQKVRNLFEIARMHRLFIIAETKEDALNATEPS